MNKTFNQRMLHKIYEARGLKNTTKEECQDEI